jgi:hypothetical protein
MANTLKALTALDLGSMRSPLGDIVAHENKRCLMMVAGACPMRFDPAPRSVGMAQTKCRLVNSTAPDAREVARHFTPIGEMHVLKQRLAQNESRVTSQDCPKGRAGIAHLAVRGGENNERRWLCADELLQPSAGLTRSLAPSMNSIDRCAEYETDA